MLLKIAFWLVIWTIISIGYFIYRLKDKTCYDEKWYDYIIFPPVMVIASFIGIIHRFKNRN